MSNKEIREKAIQITIKFEKKNGRIPKPNKDKRCGYDLTSEGRQIEVKGTKGSNPFKGFIINSQEQKTVFEQGGYIYRITGVGREPKIYVLKKGDIEIIKEPRWRVKKKKQVTPISNY